MMRILIIHNYYQHRGGEDSVVEQEATALTEHHEVKVFTTQNKKGWKGLLQFFSYPFNFVEANRIVQVAKDFQADIVHIHNLHYGLGPLVIRKLHQAGFKVVMTLHNYRLLCPSATLFYDAQLHTESIYEDYPWTAVKAKALDDSFIKTAITATTYWLHKKWGTWRMVDQYFTLSEFSKKILLDSTLDIQEKQITVKANYVDVPHPPLKRYSENFVYIGRLSVEKGILPLLSAIAKTNYCLHIYGTGPLQDQIEAYAKQYPNIIYKGFQPSTILKEALATCKALIVPSICYEGMPMTIIEAYAMGTPVLASNIGILAQMVVPLETGLHFDPYDENSIRQTLADFNQFDSAKLIYLSSQCKTYYQRFYTKNKNIALLENSYNKIITYQK